jgi:hypothetical protein
MFCRNQLWPTQSVLLRVPAIWITDRQRPVKSSWHHFIIFKRHPWWVSPSMHVKHRSAGAPRSCNHYHPLEPQTICSISNPNRLLAIDYALSSILLEYLNNTRVIIGHSVLSWQRCRHLFMLNESCGCSRTLLAGSEIWRSAIPGTQCFTSSYTYHSLRPVNSYLLSILH